MKSLLLSAAASGRAAALLGSAGATANWAIQFCRHRDFELALPERKIILLKYYRSIPNWRIEISAELGSPRFA